MLNALPYLWRQALKQALEAGQFFSTKRPEVSGLFLCALRVSVIARKSDDLSANDEAISWIVGDLIKARDRSRRLPQIAST